MNGEQTQKEAPTTEQCPECGMKSSFDGMWHKAGCSMPDISPRELQQMTQEQAQLLCDAHDVHALLNNEEEVGLMEDNNPALLAAYEKLRAIADGDDP